MMAPITTKNQPNVIINVRCMIPADFVVATGSKYSEYGEKTVEQ